MKLELFTPKEARILAVLVTHMVGTYREKDFPPTNRVQISTVTIDGFVAKLSKGLQTQLKCALHLFEWGPMLFIGKPRRFTRLLPYDAEGYIRSWAESRFGFRRRLFRGLRDMSFLGYYSQKDNEK
jgi:hypothetical protein